jgi:Flp pilus assembly pilin Flp
MTGEGSRFSKSWSKLWPELWLELWNDEQGQATTEYILILAVVITFLISMIKKFIRPAFARLAQGMSQRIEKQFFGANLHQFRIRR